MRTRQGRGLLTGLGGWAAAGTSFWGGNGFLPGSGSWRDGGERRNAVADSQHTDSDPETQSQTVAGETISVGQ